MAKKKSRKKRRQRRSRAPLLLLCLVLIGAGGFALVNFGRTDSEPQSVEPNPEASSPSLPNADETPVSTDASVVNTVAPPVVVHSDTLGDVEFDQILDDWTPVDPPSIPPHSHEVLAEWVSNSRIQENLPDGIYWGYIHSTFDEEERGFNFDVVQGHFGADACREVFGDTEDSCWDDYGLTRASQGDQLYPAYLDDLLYTTANTFPDADGTLHNAFVSPSRLWELVDSGETVANYPIRTWYLLTVIEGKVVAAEGITTP